MEKKENGVLKILRKSLIGIPLGMCLLLFSYFCVYLMVGEEIFADEISQLQDVKTFVYQFLIVAILYYVVFGLVNAIIIVGNSINKKEIEDKPIRNIIVMIIWIIVIISLAYVGFEKLNVFSDIIVYEQILILTLIPVIFFIYAFIRCVICGKLLKKKNSEK